jgi:hypothetical protein
MFARHNKAIGIPPQLARQFGWNTDETGAS